MLSRPACASCAPAGPAAGLAVRLVHTGQRFRRQPARAIFSWTDRFGATTALPDSSLGSVPGLPPAGDGGSKAVGDAFTAFQVSA